MVFHERNRLGALDPAEAALRALTWFVGRGGWKFEDARQDGHEIGRRLEGNMATILRFLRALIDEDVADKSVY
jgi:hypothetical protein